MPQSRRNKNGGQGSGVKGRSKRKITPNQSPSSDAQPLVITPAVLRRHPLPQPDEDGDKEERGRVLVVGGAPEMPGAITLAATAALRAGAGKLQIATCRSIAQLVAVTVPEARVFALPETRMGAIAASSAAEIAKRANKVQAVLIGPGMIDEKAVTRLMKNLLPRIKGATLVLDAAALECIAQDAKCLYALRGNIILTPHAGEMASILGEDKNSILRDPLATALRAASRLRAIIALKSRETYISAPDGKVYCNKTGNVGLATSGSGDTLSGIIAGLAARGAEPLHAAVWGVYLHGRAGDRLAKKVGRLGFLARELLAEVPKLMAAFAGRKKR